MFGYEDRRTAEERRRDLERQDKWNAEQLLAIGALKQTIRPLLETHGFVVGLVGSGSITGAEMLIEIDDVTYQMKLVVDHDS